MDRLQESIPTNRSRAGTPEKIVSVHFPKAAGTSLRSQFAALVGDALQLDYDHDPLTPSGGELARFPEGKKIVHGHFRAARYASDSAYLMTFLREPVDNLISFYFYWCAETAASHELHARFLRERPTILEFAAYPPIQRLMSQTYFGDFDLDRFDFVGFHETRAADLARLAAELDLPLNAAVHDNKTIASSERDAVDADPETLARLRELLSDDIAFYWRVRRRFGADPPRLSEAPAAYAIATAEPSAIAHAKVADKEWNAVAASNEIELAGVRSELAVANQTIDSLANRLRALGARIAERNTQIARLDAALGQERATGETNAERARQIEEEGRQAIEDAEARASAMEQRSGDQARLLAAVVRADYDGRLPNKLRGVRQWIPGRGRKVRRRAREYRVLAASPLFDRDWYLANNPDVGAAEMDPVYHYLRYGAREGRAPGPHFSGQAYKQANRDVAMSGENPLLHFIRVGAREGRSPGYGSIAAGLRSPTDAAAYREWVRRYDTLSEADRRAIADHLTRLDYQPLISVIMPAFDTPEAAFRQAIESVRAQLYANWELCVADDASPSPRVSAILAEYSVLDDRVRWMRRSENGHISAASNSALELARGEFVALMDHDDIIPPHALYEVVAELNDHPHADIIYSDEDKIDDDGLRFGPYFKTDWNPDLFFGHNFISHFGVYRRALVADVGGFRVGLEGSQDYDLALRCIRASSAENIRHIPAILYHWRRRSQDSGFSESHLERCVAAARKAKADHFAAVDNGGEIAPHPQIPTWERVVWRIPESAPLVTIIVPTRNRFDLLEPCLYGLMNKTSYQPIEIIVVDHESDEPKTLALLKRVSADPRVRIMRYEGAFNFSAMNNRAVELARGELVALVNNDIEVIASNWLAEMVAQAARPEVGAVGAKLLYPNRLVQHAGIGLGIGGVASALYHGSAANQEGYLGRLQLASNVSAVTAACLVVKKAAYVEVGGLNETDLRVAFNDVDFCLKLREKGYRNVWTPFATLYHHESPSRGLDTTPENAARFQRECDWMIRTWGSALTEDPYLNPNLSLDSVTFELAVPPRRIKPWRAHDVGAERKRQRPST